MKEYWLDSLGLFTKSQCESIKAQLEGKTYMKFHIIYDNYAGNCHIGFTTDYEDSEVNIKKFFLHCVLSELAKLA